MGGPDETRDYHLFPDFPKKRHGKTCHVMGSHGISSHFRTKVAYVGTNNTVFIKKKHIKPRGGNLE
jgi:hypothetical protein